MLPRTNTYFCSDKSVTAVVVKVGLTASQRQATWLLLPDCLEKNLSVLSLVLQGLAAHKDELGAPLCPCRHYDDKKAEVAQGFWNCPCVPMRERKVVQFSKVCCKRDMPTVIMHGIVTSCRACRSAIACCF